MLPDQGGDAERACSDIRGKTAGVSTPSQGSYVPSIGALLWIAHLETTSPTYSTLRFGRLLMLSRLPAVAAARDKNKWIKLAKYLREHVKCFIKIRKVKKKTGVTEEKTPNVIGRVCALILQHCEGMVRTVLSPSDPRF
ncbi:hypothetical protein CYMTET_41633 [Cymbomonas tetramitiformis]|uniref:Uncharacterized protein n=1 Tax=Cymbomonas tetramitiformis TaxID=36881 RepID=A0AAE0F3E0_9CHLO|nr:hypothetical protein CYMTET_41633 [Cymbomonas tetramitiformis]